MVWSLININLILVFSSAGGRGFGSLRVRLQIFGLQRGLAGARDPGDPHSSRATRVRLALPTARPTRQWRCKRS